MTEGAHLTGQDARAGAASSIACAPGDNGAALHYIATVPPRNRLRVTATPTGEPAWSPVVRLATGCDAATCFAVESPLFSSDAASAAWVDPAMSPAEVHVAVGGAGAGASGTFDLDVALDAPPSDDACAAATPVVDGTTLVDQDLSLASGPLPCSAGTGGHARYFRTTIPAGAALTATVAMAWNVPVAIRVLSSCAATTCLASSTFGPPYGAVLRHVNPGDAAQDVVIAVGCGPAQDPHFGLSVAIRAAGEQAAHGRPRQPVRERRGPFTPSAKPQGDPPGIRDRAAHRHALGCNGVTSPRTRAHAPRLASHFDRLWTVP